MRYHETPPSPDLAPLVRCVWELHDDGLAFTAPILPDGHPELVVHLGERPTPFAAAAPQPETMIVGQMTTALRLQPVARLHAVGVRFTPAGARAWLGTPLHGLTDRITAADEIDRRLARRLRDAAHRAATPAQRARRIERELRAMLSPGRRSPVVEHAVRETIARGGRASIDTLARACQVSARHLERQYLDAVGLTPKAFARTVRFHRALQALRRGAPAADVAAACGFADQPHLAREFRRFAGAAAREIDLAQVAFLQDDAPRAAAH